MIEHLKKNLQDIQDTNDLNMAYIHVIYELYY